LSWEGIEALAQRLLNKHVRERNSGGEARLLAGGRNPERRVRIMDDDSDELDRSPHTSPAPPTAVLTSAPTSAPTAPSALPAAPEVRPRGRPRLEVRLCVAGLRDLATRALAAARKSDTELYRLTPAMTFIREFFADAGYPLDRRHNSTVRRWIENLRLPEIKRVPKIETATTDPKRDFDKNIRGLDGDF
jgi:hypothetical protein